MPVAVGATAESLANLTLATSLPAEGQATIHADIGRTSTVLNLFEGRVLRFSREIEVGSATFTRALTRPVATFEGERRLTPEEAEAARVTIGFEADPTADPFAQGVRPTDVQPLLEPVLQRLTTELGRSVEYLRAIVGGAGIDGVELTGSGAEMPGLDRMLQAGLGVRVTRVDPLAAAVERWRLALRGELPSSTADFGAILGFALTTERPINLLPREEQVRDLVSRAAVVRKVAGPCALALAVVLSMTAVPVLGSYDSAEGMLRATADDLGRQLREDDAHTQALGQALAQAAQVTAASGPAPDWTGLLQELPAVLPVEVQLQALSASREGEVVSLRLQATLHHGAAAPEAVIADAARALGASPFFSEVRVVDAQASTPSTPGRFEATLHVVAPPRSIALEEQP